MANKKLIALVGTVAAGILYTATPSFEGTIYKGYRDPVGIPTACTGRTGPEVVVGQRYTPQQCADLFDEDMYRHAAGVLMCTPQLKDKPYALAAASDFAFNMGVNAWCNSSMAGFVREGAIRLACVRFNENAQGKPQWVYATRYKKDKNGKFIIDAKGNRESEKIILPGLVTRAAWRRSSCEKSL